MKLYFKIMAKLQKMAKEAVKETLAKKWYRDLRVVKNDITVLLFYPHGGINPKTGKYVMGRAKQSPKWDNKKPVHMENIFYEGVGMRKVVDYISIALDYLGVKNIIVNDTWEDTPIHKKREMAFKLDLDHSKVIGLETHANATKNMQGKAKGFEIFTWPGKNDSDKHALIYGKKFEQVIPEMKHRRFRANEEKEARFGILKLDKIGYKELIKQFSKEFIKKYLEKKKTGFPMILTECGFMDNEKFCKTYLMKNEGLQQIAHIHVLAIIDIIKKYYHANNL